LYVTSCAPGKTGISKLRGKDDEIVGVDSIEIGIAVGEIAVAVGGSSVGDAVGMFSVRVGRITGCETAVGIAAAELHELIKKTANKATMEIFWFTLSSTMLSTSLQIAGSEEYEYIVAFYRG
jgi:hypothetical protein